MAELQEQFESDFEDIVSSRCSSNKSVIDCAHAQKEIISQKTNEQDKDKAATREGLCAFARGRVITEIVAP